MTLRVEPEELVQRKINSGRPGLIACAPQWPRVRLGEIADVVNGAAFKSSDFNIDGLGMPLIRIRDVGSAEASTWYSGEWEERYLVRHGDLLVGMDGDFRAACWAGPDSLLNQRVCRVQTDPQQYDPRFMALVLPGYLDMVWEATSATTVKHLSSRSVQGLPIPKPPLEVQRRIVEIVDDHLSRLDAADGYAASAERRAHALVRSASAVEFPGHGPRVALGDLISGIEAGRSLGGAGGPAGPGEWGIIKVSAMTWGMFRAEENKVIPAHLADARYEIREGDLLVSRANTSSYVGASVLVGQVPPGLLLSDKSLRLTPRPGVATEWLWRALQSPSARAQISALATGTKDSMRNISQKSLLRVWLPDHDADQQRAAVARYRRVEDAARRVQAEVVSARRRAVAVKVGLLEAAFSGRLTERYANGELTEQGAQ